MSGVEVYEQDYRVLAAHEIAAAVAAHNRHEGVAVSIEMTTPGGVRLSGDDFVVDGSILEWRVHPASWVAE